MEYIHHYNKQYRRFKERVKKDKKISNKNKALIFKFESECFLKEKLALPTRVKYFDVLGNLARKYAKKDFDKFTRKDFENLVAKLENRTDIGVSTKQKYRAIIKKFGKWLKYKHNYLKLLHYQSAIHNY